MVRLAAWRVPLMVFEVRHALLPGETLQIDMREQQALSDAIERVEPCAELPLTRIFGQVLPGDGPSTMYPVVPLLQIVHRPASSCSLADDYVVTVKCVGRTRVLRFDEKKADRMLCQCPTGWLAPFVDQQAVQATSEDRRSIEELRLSATRLFESCNTLRDRLPQNGRIGIGGSQAIGALGDVRWSRDSSTCVARGSDAFASVRT